MTRGLVPTTIALIVCAGFGWIATDRWLTREWNGEKEDAQRYRTLQSSAPRGVAPIDSSSSDQPIIQFEDVANRIGIDFVYDDGAKGDFHLMETIGGGMAVADFDRDGSLDVFFPNGCSLPVDSTVDSRPSALFLGNGKCKSLEKMRYQDVASIAGADLRRYCQGAAAADFNHDGFEDLLVTGFQVLKLFRNQGDGTFVPQATGIRDDGELANRWWTSAAWFDCDDDGDLDVYVCAYATVDVNNPKDCRRGDLRMHCHPSSFSAEPDALLKNNGDGEFHDVAAKLGFSEKVGRGLGVAVADFTGKGKPSVYVANDTSEAFLWTRDESNHLPYSNRAGSLGVGLTSSGATMAGMGVAVGDYDRNGLPDLFVTDFYEAGASLFANFGDIGFVPKSTSTGLLAPTRRRLGFGTSFLDADLDGWPDLVAVNGHVSDLTSIGIPYKMKAEAFRNDAGKRFIDVSNSAGEFFRRPLLGRGLATGDFDDDGRPDFVVSNIRDPAALLLNRTQPCGDWIGFEFVGRVSARSSRNVKITLKRGGKTDRFEQHSGGGFLSSSDPRFVVGLGRSGGSIDEVEIAWPSGLKQMLYRPAQNRYHLVVEPLESAP